MKNVLLFFLFILGVLNVNAQHNYELKGVISDYKSGEKLIGIDVFIEGTNIGTSTNAEGFYLLQNIPMGRQTITISAIGYETITKRINFNKTTAETLNLELIEATESLSEIIVTAKSEARKLRERAMPISVISINELKGTVSDINGVLAKTSGVQLRNTGGVGSSSRISLRGLEGKRVGYFIDGYPMNDNSDFMDLNDIPIDMIDRIEIYKGIVPAKLGGSAIGGAVNIVLKEYPPRYTDFSYTLSSFNTHKINTVTKRNKNGYEFGIGGMYVSSDNNYKMELPKRKGTFIRREHDKFKKITVGAAFAAKNNKWWFDKVEFSPTFSQSAKQIQGIEYNIQEAESFAKGYLLETKAEKDNFFLDGLDVDYSLSTGYTVFEFEDKAMQKYDWDGTPRPANTQYGGEINSPSDSKNKKYIAISKLNLNYLINEWSSFNLNATLNYAKGKPSDPLRDKAIGNQTVFDSKMYSCVTGLNYEVRLFDNKLMNSLTTKYYEYRMQTKSCDIYNFGKVSNIDNKKTDWGVNNAIRYRLTPAFLVKTSLAYDVRLPSDNELLGDGFVIKPSGNLIPEKSSSVNIGALYEKDIEQTRKLSIEINAFYNYLENMIRFVGGPLQSNYTNFGEMKTLGAEIEVKWDATSFLYLYGNTTYQDLRDEREYDAGSSSIPNDTKGDRMPNIPYFFANAGIELHKENLFGGQGQNSRLFIDSSFVEEYYYDFEQSVYQQRRIPRTHTVDLGLEHSFKDQSFIIGLQINNLTDEVVMSEFNRPLPGRNAAIKLRYILK